MPIPWRALGGTIAAGGTCTLLSFFYATRSIQFVPLLDSDPIFQSEYTKALNPHGNPTIHDLHVKRVPLSQIDPAYLRDPKRLLDRYCGGMWAGLGFAPQRILHTLSSKDTNDSPTSLWSPAALLDSDYKKGSEVTGHLQVIERSNDMIVLRGGVKVPNEELRPLDAFLEVTARVDEEQGIAEFGFKSIFFQGLGKTDKLPMPGPAIWLHEQYAKALLEFGVRYVLK
ncbi:hypothetical protein BJY04DRAFT_186679 [Aspergillus karnatakaensis]|uniref:uncharacterized protein n=1 Tax=Aspergillus karnatakaensis TaxID=1810916 RepID=UPI003CCE4D92